MAAFKINKILSKEEQLAKNIAIITFGKACTQLISFFLLPLYTAVLSTEDYGEVDLILTYISLFLPVLTLALEQALFRYLIDVREYETEKEIIISTVGFFMFAQCVLIIIISCIVRFFLKSNLLVYFSLLLIATIFSSCTLQLSRGLGDSLGYALGSLITAITQIACNIFFLVFMGLGISGMLLANIFGNFLCAAVIIFRVKLFRYLKLHLFSFGMLKKLLGYSLPLIPNQLSWWALNASDKVIVQMILGVGANGIIAVANKFSSFYMQFSNIFNISWTESATLYIHDKDAQAFFDRTINCVYKLFLCACCGMICCIPFVFSKLINEQYKRAYTLVPLFMLSSLFNVVVSLYGVIYVAYKRSKEIAQTAIYAAIINIIIHLISIPFIGIYAAAVSTMGGYGCMAIYRYFHSRRYLIVRLEKETLIASILMVSLSLVSYYVNCASLRVVMLLIVGSASVRLNLDLLRSGYRIIKGT